MIAGQRCEVVLPSANSRESEYINSFEIFPNPVREALFIDLKAYIGEPASISINNLYG